MDIHRFIFYYMYFAFHAFQTLFKVALYIDFFVRIEDLITKALFSRVFCILCIFFSRLIFNSNSRDARINHFKMQFVVLCSFWKKSPLKFLFQYLYKFWYVNKGIL